MCYCIMNIGRFSLQNVGLFEMKMLIKLCKLYLMAAYNEIFDGIAEFPPFSDGWCGVSGMETNTRHTQNI